MQSQKPPYPPSVWIALALVYVVWGSTYLAIRIAVQTFPPFFMAGARFLISGIILYGWMRLRGTPRPSGAHWKSAAIIGFFLLAAANGGVSWAEQRVPSGMTALLVATVPLWMVLLEWVWKKGDRPGPGVWAGLFLGFAGITVLVFSRPGSDSLRVDPLWALLLVSTSLSWSYGSLYARSARLPPSVFLSTSMEMIAGGLLLLGGGFLSGEGREFHFSSLSAHSLGAWLYLSLVGSLVGFTSYIWVLQKATPDLASTYAFVNPVIAVFLGWLVAGEPLTPPLFLAAGLIVSAVVLITRVSKKP